jgi:NADPH2:quinone reductase
MQAIRVHQFGGPEMLQVDEIPAPEPADGQVLVRVEAAGVNPVETYIRSGAYGQRSLPYTPGSDAAGTIQAVGAGVTLWSAGDRVYASATLTGSYAQLTLCEPSAIHRLPKAVSFAQGACIGVPCATAHRALFARGEARAGQTVLIHGATGGVGTAAVQLARTAGLTVIATGGSEEGRKLLGALSAHHVVDHCESDYLRRVMVITSGRGVDLILEMLANVNLGRDLETLAPRGRVVVVGSRGPVQINPRELMRRDADVRGMMLFHASSAELGAIHLALQELLEHGTLVPVVGRQFPLAEAAEAHRRIIQDKALGNIVLLPSRK